MSFVEERLNLGIVYGTTATITTKTAIVENFAGVEARSINWAQPLLKFNIGQRGCLNQELQYFIAFHKARKGAYEGFRFKDWSDYEFNQVITVNANKQAQLFKTYTVAGVSVKRPLVKIVTGTVSVFVDNNPVTQGWTLNYNTGVITFEEIPTGTIRVSGEFDVPVRFETDKIDLRFEACEPESGRKIFNWESLSLSEVRVAPAIPLSFDLIPQSLNHVIDWYDYGTVGGNKFATRIERLVSGLEKRNDEWLNPRGEWEIGARTLLKSELNYLIALFRVCRGKAVSFKYFDRRESSEVPVRFGEDAIAFRFDAYEQGTGRVIFNLAGMPLVAIINPDPITPPVLSNTGYGTGWDRPISNNSYGWNGAGDAISKWLTFPEPAPPKTGDNFDWIVTYSFNSPLGYFQKARFMVDNFLMAVQVNGFQVITGPIGGFPAWTEIELFISAGAVVISFTVRNVAPGEPNGFQTFNPTGFRLEWL